MRPNSWVKPLGIRWKQILLGALTAFLLAPLPAYATLIFGTWTSDNVNWVTTGSSAGSLILQPPTTPLAGPVTVNVSNTVSSDVGGESLSALISNLQTLHLNSSSTVSVGITVVQGTPLTILDSSNPSNQFSGVTDLPLTLTTSTVNLANANPYTINVTFTFTGSGTHQATASSAINIQFTN